MLTTSADGHTQTTSKNYTVQDNSQAVETLVDDSRTGFAVPTFPANKQLQSPGTFEIFEDKMHDNQDLAEVLLTIWDQGSHSHRNVTVQNTETAMNDLQTTMIVAVDFSRKISRLILTRHIYQMLVGARHGMSKSLRHLLLRQLLTFPAPQLFMFLTKQLLARS